ncbi:hypothetical protein FA13DRAFT_729221 [Coprinellus micaceus]|uniref:Uncharacterized protein n=1 Tax=Coprinellus micaceus TaxID=71717 RepID=A0A4Y7TVJ3_COPMI|nr:hypothetical protein FA13DRAFT_729221 [Coprinellus micaceus]
MASTSLESRRAAVRERLAAPFGSWDIDIERDDLGTSALSIVERIDDENNTKTVGIWKNTYFVKTVDNNHHGAYQCFIGDIFRQLLMMLIAEEECTPRLVGRVFDEGAICGYIHWQRLGCVLDPGVDSRLRANSTSLPSPREQIYALQKLVDRLHEAGVDSTFARHDLTKLIHQFKEGYHRILRVYAIANLPTPDWDILKTKTIEWAAFDRVFASGVAGARIPDPDFFRHVEEAGCSPTDSLFMDYESVKAARSVATWLGARRSWWHA